MKTFSKKIVFIIPTLQKGGMERVLSILANNLSRRAYKVSIVTLINSKIEYPLDKEIELIPLGIVYSRNLLIKLKILFKLFVSLRGLRKEDVLISFGERFNSLSIIAAKLNGLKIFISDRNNPYASNGRVNDLLSKFIYPLADGIIAQTKSSKKVMAKKGLNTNIEVVSNPLSGVFFRNKKSFAEERNIIISVGRLDELKNHIDLIHIFKEIDNESWKLQIIGNGRLYNYLNSEIIKLKLENRVKLMGSKDNVIDYLNKASVFAFTSLSEGYPNVLIEAMAVPLACISYDCEVGPSDLIKDGENGYLVPMGDKELFKEKLKVLIENKNIRDDFSSKARLVGVSHDENLVVEKLINFINRN